MPLYEYQCDACGTRFEVIQKFSDPPAETCKVCGKGPVQRLFSSPAIQFKGSGWYITDYGQKGKSDSSKEKASAEKKSDTAAKTETKSESSTPSTSTPSTSSSSGDKD